MIINGECLEQLSHIPDCSVDLFILDLPYGQTNCNWDGEIDLVELWSHLKRIGKPNTPYFFFCTSKFGYKLIKSNEKWFRYDLVWFKENSNAGFLNARKMPMRNHEMLYVFYDKLPFYNIEANHIRVAENPNASRMKNTSDVYSNNPNLVHRSGRAWDPALPKSVLCYDANMNRHSQLHPTEKPIKLLEWIIRYYTKDGATVLDPTMGVGSTGVACANLGRFFIGIELNVEYFNIAKSRLENAVN